jgi:aspartate-semialdehyde dehydrogenase
LTSGFGLRNDPFTGALAMHEGIDFSAEVGTPVVAAAPGVVVQQNDADQFYPMPLWAHEKDDVFVGRLRRDETQPKTLNMWIVSDNLRKGAATNAIQIAEYLASKGII